MMFVTILFYSALLSGFLPWPLLCLRKKTFSFAHYPIAPYLFYIFIATFYELLGTQIFRINTTYWFQFGTAIEIITLYWYFFKTIQEDEKFLIKWGLFIAIILYAVSFIFWRAGSSLNTLGINHIALFLLVLVCVLVWVQRLFRETAVRNLWAYPDFYFVAGIAFYYFSTLFLFLFSRYIYEHHLGLSDFWLLNVVATLILRLTLTLGVWKIR